MEKALKRCMDHGQLVMGREIDDLEKTLADYVGRKKCISLSSGTDAVYLALKALDIGPKDEVITTPSLGLRQPMRLACWGEPVFVILMTI